MIVDTIKFIFEQIPENAPIKTIVFIVLLVLFLYSLTQANTIYEFFDKVNKSELSEIRDLLADKNISETAKKKLKETIDLIAYKKVTGINANKYWQKKIINCYELAEGRLRYSDFKRAFIFLKIDNHGNLEIRKPNIIEWILIIASTVTSVALFFVFLLLQYIVLVVPISIQQQIATLLLTVLMFCLLLIYLSPLSSTVAAKKIKKEIKLCNLKNKHLKPYGLFKGEFTVPDDFDKEKELGASLSNLSTQQLNLVYQFIATLENKKLTKGEIPETNEDIDLMVEHYRQQNKLLPIGLAKEKFTVPDDFDDSLPDEILDLYAPK